MKQYRLATGLYALVIMSNVALLGKVIYDGLKWQDQISSAQHVYQEKGLPAIQYAMFDDNSDGVADRILKKIPTMAGGRAIMPGSTREYINGEEAFNYIIKRATNGDLKRKN